MVKERWSCQVPKPRPASFVGLVSMVDFERHVADPACPWWWLGTANASSKAVLVAAGYLRRLVTLSWRERRIADLTLRVVRVVGA